MRVSIGIKPRSGPYGGGNQAMKALVGYLRDRGIEVCHDLGAPGLDVVMLTDPRKRSESAAYSHDQIRRYLRRSPDALVVHRVNECDERKRTTGVNRVLRMANRLADHTVFVSEWLRDLHLSQGMRALPNSVIRNGSDRRIFHPQGSRDWEHGQKIRLVTHHWGAHELKGFDVYGALDRALGGPLGERVEFTFVGNLMKGFELLHSRYVPPLHGEALATELRRHHVYLTASRFEPGGNHQNEGANCGLPLLYHKKGGGNPEYCAGFGISFGNDDLFARLDEMIATYPRWRAKMVGYPHHSERMCAEYSELFEDLVRARHRVVARRRLRRVLEIAHAAASRVRVRLTRSGSSVP